MFFEFQISFFEKTRKTHEFTGFFKKPGLNWIFSKIWVFYKPCATPHSLPVETLDSRCVHDKRAAGINEKTSIRKTY